VAQTWLVSERKLRAAKVADRLLAPLLPVLRRIFPPTGRGSEPPAKILVSELWHIGDVVIAMPFLAALRARFPSARITLLSKGHAREVVAGSGLVDEVIAADLPWTFLEEDTRSWGRSLMQIPALVRRLRRERFDLAFDCSRDGRNHLLLSLSGSARRIGFAYGGGAALLTDGIPAGSLDLHRSEDWLRLLGPLGDVPRAPAPRLKVEDSERAKAEEFLRSGGYRPGERLVAIHPGGSSRLKRWSTKHFEELAVAASEVAGTRILWIVDPRGTGEDAELPPRTIPARPSSLRELIALLSLCDLLVCNDGGPMHLASATGVATLGIYSWGRPEWWRPAGPARHSWVHRSDITCRPCAGHCIFKEPICLTGLELGTVREALLAELDAMASRAQ
jgi:ADP-heptose:LPS heptosyltransferase